MPVQITMRKIFSRRRLIIIFKKLREEPDFELTSAFNTYIYSISRLFWLKHLRQHQENRDRSVEQGYGRTDRI